MVSGINGLVDDFCVSRELPSGKNTLVVIFLGLMTQYENNFALRIDPTIVVVVEFRGADPVAREDQGSV